MITQDLLQRLSQIDLTQAMLTENPIATPFLSLLLANKRTKAMDVSVSKKQKVLDTTSSGKKNEGAKVTAFQKTSYNYISNTCEIFTKAVSISGTSQAIVGANGGKDLLKSELSDRLLEMQNDIEKAVIDGTESKTDPRAMKGVLKVGNKTTLTTDLTLADIEKEVLALYNVQNTKEIYIMCNPTDKFKLDSVLLNRVPTQMSLIAGANNAGIYVENWYSSLGVLCRVLPVVNLPAGKILIIDLDKMEFPVLRDVKMEELSKTGDSIEAMLVAENTNILSPLSVRIIELNQA